jgi:hypothetical protein
MIPSVLIPDCMGLHRSRPVCDRPGEQPAPEEGCLRFPIQRDQHVGNDENFEDSKVMQMGERTLIGKPSTGRAE